MAWINVIGGFWVLVISSITVGWYWFYNYNNKVKKKKKKMETDDDRIPKGSLGWPLIGETLDFIASGYSSRPVSFMDKRKSLYGKVFKTHILGTPIIVSTDPEVNKAILQNHGNTFIPAYPKSIRELLGPYSILQTNGIIQKRLHTVIGSFLRSPLLKSRITKHIETTVKLTLSSWTSCAGLGHHRRRLIHLQDETKNITFEVLVNVLMSVGPGGDLDFLKREFREFIKGLICLPVKFPGTRLYKSLKAKEKMLKMVRRIVEERIVTRGGLAKVDDNPVVDVVDVLLQNNCESSSDEMQRLPLDFISGNIVEMMIPGEETMPTAMTLAVKFLSDCPVALEQIKVENMELKKQKTDSREEYAWTDYMSLPFTQNVISETLRMANIINGVWRKALKDVEIKGHLIPEGWCVMASFSSVHMDEENYVNPYQFDPWRWEKMGASSTNNSSFTPFGGGQRLCPGLELSRLQISIFLHHLLTIYKWAAEKDEIIYFPTVKMRRKLPIVVTPL